VDRVSFMLPPALKAEVEREAKSAGLSFSEYVRQALMVALAWGTAVRAVEAGAAPGELVSARRMAELLARVSREIEKG
jgi:hypothetical protein